MLSQLSTHRPNLYRSVCSVWNHKLPQMVLSGHTTRSDQLWEDKNRPNVSENASNRTSGKAKWSYCAQPARFPIQILKKVLISRVKWSQCQEKCTQRDQWENKKWTQSPSAYPPCPPFTEFLFQSHDPFSENIRPFARACADTCEHAQMGGCWQKKGHVIGLGLPSMACKNTKKCDIWSAVLASKLYLQNQQVPVYFHFFFTTS